jgi:PAS domain S-box-containing protein
VVSHIRRAIDLSTDHNKDEQNLRESQSLLEATLESTADGLLIVDGNGRIARFNKTFVEMWQIPKDIVESGSDDAALNFVMSQLDDPNQFIRKVRELYNNPDATSFDILTFKDGRVFERYSQPQKTGSSIVGRVWSFRDVTERKLMEARIRQTEKLTAIGQLAGGIAHDFNNQLTGIMGYADMLVRSLEDPELKKYAEGILSAAQRATDLTHKLLAFGRKDILLNTPVDIHKLIAEVAAMLDRSINKNIHISQHLNSQKSIVTGDPTQIQNAILNLALNARDAMIGGGKLTFETTVAILDHEFCRRSPLAIQPGRFLVINITDTGTGMTNEVKNHLFEPFFTTKKPGEGTGMGLASVYGTIQNHHGTISIYSELGLGTTVRIWLPLTADAVGTANNEPKAPSPGRANIMIIDDESGILDVTVTMLTKLGYSVTAFDHTRDAIDYYQTNWKQIDIVILDMIMPEISGRAAFKIMRQINPAIRVILSSGFSLNAEVQVLLNEGVKDFIGKPYVKAELSQKIEEVISGKTKT